MTDPTTTAARVAPFPKLLVADWQPTRDTLHMWLQIVGKVKLVLSPPINHWWHSTLRVTARGLAAAAIPVDGRLLDIEFDFVEHCLVLRTSDGGRRQFALAGLSVAQFHDAVMASLAGLGIEVEIHPGPNEVVEAIPFADDHVHDTYVPEAAHAFWQQLVYAQRMLARFRSGVRGKCSPVHFFWGALDLAVTQFSGRDAPVHPGGAPNCPDSVMVEGYSEELSSAGFWPGGGDEGAFYAYAYPAPDGYDQAAMPVGAGYSDGYGEFLLPAEAVRTAADPDALVQDFLQATARGAAELGHWPDRSGSDAGR